LLGLATTKFGALLCVAVCTCPCLLRTVPAESALVGFRSYASSSDVLRLAGRSSLQSILSHQQSPQPHHETPPASRKHRCRLCLFISTLLASPSKHPKIAQSGAVVGLVQRAPSLFNTSVCQSKWFANLASRRPGQRGRFERSQPINHVTYSWTPAHGSRRVGQAAAANVWSNSLRAGVSCAWQKEPLYIGNREVVNVVL